MKAAIDWAAMDKERQAARERELPEWAFKLPQVQQRMIRQARWMTQRFIRERHANAAREAADAILYGVKR